MTTHRLLLSLILILASFLRLINLHQSPPSPYWEEVALGYDAYSILKTGKDHHSHSFPLIAFESFGDWKPSVYFYAAVPFIAVFGLNPTAVRLPSVLAGIFAVYLIYQLTLTFSQNKTLSLISALVLATLPWHLQFSRAAFEINLGTTLLSLGILILIKSRHKPSLMPLAALVLITSLYTYHGLRVLSPLIAIMIMISFYKEYIKSTKYILISTILAFLLVLPLLLQINSNQITQRFQETSLFTSINSAQIINQLRSQDGNTLSSRIIHHRYWFWANKILSGSLSHFNLDFLFLIGDHNPRHQTGLFALLYHWQIIPLLFGFAALNQSRYRQLRFNIGWILLATLPAALTKTTPHTLRFLPASIPFSIIIALGIYQIFHIIKTSSPSLIFRLFNLTFVLIILSQFTAYLYHYHHTYPLTSSSSWQYGYQQLVSYIEPIKTRYSKIFITNQYGRPAMYFLFFSQYPPQKLHSQLANLSFDQGEVLSYDNYVFSNHYSDLSLNSTALFVTAQPQANLTPIHLIEDLNHQPVFYLYEI